MRFRNLLKESPESDLKMLAYQIQAALKKFGVGLDKNADSVSNYKPLSQELGKMEDSIAFIMRRL